MIMTLASIGCIIFQAAAALSHAIPILFVVAAFFAEDECPSCSIS